MEPPALNILVVSDTHFCKDASPEERILDRYVALGPLLLRKALLRLRHMGVSVDLLVLPGDLLDDGSREDSEAALALFAAEAAEAGLPVLAVPGNHDRDPTRVARVFSCEAGLHEMGGYGFLLFHDPAEDGDVTTRSDGMLSLPEQIASRNPALPLVALQHNPVFPSIDSKGYPYMPTNTEAIRESYRKAGVVLSISGHYHQGQPLQPDGEVAYYTAPAACEKPFRFAVIHLRGRNVTIDELHLELDDENLVDVHCHTEFAYCGEDVTAEWNIFLSHLLGLSGLCLVEHVFQVYFDNETAWSYRWKHDRDLLEKALAGPHPRMEAYRSLVDRLRSAGVCAGLEVDLVSGGGLLLADADREGWDLLVGAVHELTGPDPRTDAEADRAFLSEVEQLLQHPIDVLAHPFRWFRRANRPRPVHLYGEVAQMLADAGVAAEINFHTNEPDPLFFEECLHRGVKLALGSDSHNRAEVGELYPHTAFLKKLGVTDLAACCYSPVSEKDFLTG